MSLASGISGVEAVVRSLIIANTLGVKGYAVYALVMAFNRPLTDIMNANFGAALVRFGAEFQESKDQAGYLAIIKLFFLLTLLSATAAVLMNSILILFAERTFFDESWITGYLILIAFGLSLRLFETLMRTLMIMHDKYKQTAAISVCRSLLSIAAIAVVALVYGASLQAMLAITIATLLLSPLAMLIVVVLCLRQPLAGTLQAKLSALKGRIKEIAKFTFGNSMAKSLDSATKSCDLLLLGAFGSEIAITIYDISKKLGNVFFMMKDPIVSSVFPQVARLISGRKYRELQQTLKGAYILLAIPIGIVVIGIFFFSGALIRLFSPELSEPGWTPVIVLIRNLIPLVFFWTTPLILSLSMIRFQLISRMVTIVIGFTIAWFLVETHQDVGVAIGMLLGVVLGQVLNLGFGVMRVNQELLKMPSTPVPADS